MWGAAGYYFLLACATSRLELPVYPLLSYCAQAEIKKEKGLRSKDSQIESLS